MSIYRKKQWYVASIGGLTACSHDRLEAQRLVLAMYSLTLHQPVIPAGIAGIQDTGM